MMKRLLKKLINGYCRDTWWYFYGDTFRPPPLLVKPISIMFICKGNICRSPFAEHIARRLFQENGLSNVILSSSGLEVTQSESAPVAAIAAAKKFDVDLNKHRSQQLSIQKALASDLIVAMEAKQVKTLRKLYPDLKHKFFLLSFFEKNGSWGKGYLKYNIPDPYGKSTKVFDDCYRRIVLATEQMLRTTYTNNQRED